MNDFSVAGIKEQGRADKVTEAYTGKIAHEPGGYAPTDTGELRANPIASPHRLAPASWQFGGTLAYTRRQEYENKTKKGFIRKAVWNNRTPYRERLREEIARFGK